MSTRARIMKSIIKTYKDFAQNTSIHGLKYTTQKNAGIFERFAWVLIVCMGIMGSLYMLNILVERFNSNPTRTSIVNQNAPLNEIPFPAISICPIQRMRSSKYKKLMSVINYNSSDVSSMGRIFDMFQGTNFHLDSKDSEDTLVEILIKYNYVDVGQLLQILSQNCSEMMIMCKWEGEEVNCNDYFRENYTPNGYCCSFNFDPKKPLQSIYHGLKFGLTVVINPMVEDHDVQYGYSVGMKTILHHQNQYPSIESTEKLLEPGTEVYFQLSGTRFVASKEVTSLKKSQRHCLFSEDVKLKYFKKYTITNCIAECRIEIIMERCKCIPFFYNVTEHRKQFHNDSYNETVFGKVFILESGSIIFTLPELHPVEIINIIAI
ncbi:hypothetical protein FQA39_LY13609 [Lamprigera yunnana]|nr:hypothetical protein FQA39_LY13609 [Lamprigera yunnana]